MQPVKAACRKPCRSPCSEPMARMPAKPCRSAGWVRTCPCPSPSSVHSPPGLYSSPAQLLRKALYGPAHWLHWKPAKCPSKRPPCCGQQPPARPYSSCPCLMNPGHVPWEKMKPLVRHSYPPPRRTYCYPEPSCPIARCLLRAHCGPFPANHSPPAPWSRWRRRTCFGPPRPVRRCFALRKRTRSSRNRSVKMNCHCSSHWFPPPPLHCSSPAPNR